MKKLLILVSLLVLFLSSCTKDEELTVIPQTREEIMGLYTVPFPNLNREYEMSYDVIRPYDAIGLWERDSVKNILMKIPVSIYITGRNRMYLIDWEGYMFQDIDPEISSYVACSIQIGDEVTSLSADGSVVEIFYHNLELVDHPFEGTKGFLTSYKSTVEPDFLMIDGILNKELWIEGWWTR